MIKVKKKKTRLFINKAIYTGVIKLLAKKEKITPLKIAKISKVDPKNIYNRIYNCKIKIGEFKE